MHDIVPSLSCENLVQALYHYAPGGIVSNRFRILGEIEVSADGSLLTVGHSRQRHVLAALLVDANQRVAVGELTDRVYGERHPPSARESIYSYVSRLRSALASARDVALDNQSGGYAASYGAAHPSRRPRHDRHNPSDGDAGTDRAVPRTALARSCQTLPADVQRAFALIGLAPGPEIGLLAAASLTGLPAARTRRQLKQLERVHLLCQYAPGCYRMHELVWSYAAERAIQYLGNRGSRNGTRPPVARQRRPRQ